MKRSAEIIQLCHDIEQHIGQKLQSPTDFEKLLHRIWENTHSVLSLSTIKRLWGYVESNGVPRLSTLNTLSQFLGYADWNTYLVTLEQQGDIESDLFQGKGICSSTLNLNDKIEVSWLPNRRCVFRYLGENRFVVEEAKYAKIKVGDTFSASCFIIGHPMYLDHLRLADGTITSYVAGKKNGISNVKLINE